VTREEAKSILLLYRTSADGHDPEIAAALEQARQDPELQRWFEEHKDLQARLRQKFAELPVPGDLKEAILAGRKIVRPALWWQQPAWLAAAALIALLIGIGAFWLRPAPTERFGLYRARMMRSVLHEYTMDMQTNDLRSLQRYLDAQGAPADFEVPKPLEQLKLTGGGRILWGKEPASMVCFDRGDKQMLFLFVINSGALKGEPQRPKLAKIGTLQTLSWTRGAHIYVLGGPDDPDFAQKYGPVAMEGN
jgi:hypothetical protein